jgi:hypothetical protein
MFSMQHYVIHPFTSAEKTEIHRFMTMGKELVILTKLMRISTVTVKLNVYFLKYYNNVKQMIEEILWKNLFHMPLN